MELSIEVKIHTFQRFYLLCQVSGSDNETLYLVFLLCPWWEFKVGKKIKLQTLCLMERRPTEVTWETKLKVSHTEFFCLLCEASCPSGKHYDKTHFRKDFGVGMNNHSLSFF